MSAATVVIPPRFLELAFFEPEATRLNNVLDVILRDVLGPTKPPVFNAILAFVRLAREYPEVDHKLYAVFVVSLLDPVIATQLEQSISNPRVRAAFALKLHAEFTAFLNGMKPDSHGLYTKVELPGYAGHHRSVPLFMMHMRKFFVSL